MPAGHTPGELSLHKIVVPTDFSATSLKALAYALTLAGKLGAKITLLHVVEPFLYPGDLSFIPPGVEVSIEESKRSLHALADRLVKPELLDHVIVMSGTPCEIIEEIARDLKTDLIIISTHGHTGLKHVLMGSTAEKVVRHAPCPVLVVREREHEFV